jgi:hypothetical protein
MTVPKPNRAGFPARIVCALVGAFALLLAAVPVKADLPIKDGLIVWLKADAVDTNDANQVRIEGSDVFIKQWNDQSGNSHPASNATDADQPTYIVSALNGQPVLRFAQDNDDTGDRLYLGDLSASFPSAGTMFAIGTIDNDGRYNLFGNCDNDERWVANTWSESHPGSFRGSRASGSFSYGSWPQTGSHVFALESSSAVYRMLIDGTQVGSDTADYNRGNGQNWNIGNRATSGQQLQGDIPELILFNRILTAEEAGQVGGYLAAKYGLSTAYPGAPAAPTGLRATPSNLKVALDWTPSAWATSYNIWSSNSVSGAVQIDTTGATAYTKTGLDNGTLYYFKVSATNFLGESAYSAEISATPTAVLSSGKDILTFSFGALGSATISGTNIVKYVAPVVDVTALSPTYTVSPFAAGAPASGTSRNFTTLQTYTVTAEDGTTKNYTVKVIKTPPIIYDFNSGLQGWTQIWPAPANGNVWENNALGSGYDGGDTRFARSPKFFLDGSGDLTFQLDGGESLLAAPDVSPSAIPELAIQDGGFSGLALRDVAADTYVLSRRRAGNDGTWQNSSFTMAELAPYANNGKQYTLDYIDYKKGGWGWTYMDNVSIPGALVPPAVLSVPVPSILIGSNVTAVVSIPSGYNATAPVTVYLTNSNPSAITIDGSSAPVITLTFAAGAASSQNLTVLGAGLGYAQLTTGSASLISQTAGLTVLTPSGLIGHWLTGAQDLLDKSGYSPTGTHDGVLSGGLTPAFSADVPPGATTGSSSLDLATSTGAVLINNTVTTDAGYRPTFDDGTAQQLSVAFWAKGLPVDWDPYVSKGGEGAAWQVRKHYNQPAGTFTLRGTGGEDDPFNGSTLINDGAWHHFAATWDGVAGVRKLYVDGKLNNVVPHDSGPMSLAKVNYLTLGGRCGDNSSTPGNTFSGQLYDVQIYGVALNGSAVQSIFTMNTAAIVAYADTPGIDLSKTGQVSISIPASANASTAVTVYVTNTTPAIVSVAGAVSDVLSLTFPAGGATSQSVTLTGLSEGQAQLACAAAGLTGASATARVYGPHLIGQWFAGTESFTNSSTFTPPGTHDGTEVGTIGTITFTADTPPSKPGKAAQFGGAVGLQIGNSSLLDTGYTPTFDDAISHQFSVSFWAKGIPGTWNGFVSKRGEDAIGWQVRRGSGITEAFTIRGTGSGNEDGVGSVPINDGEWHHFSAVWDGWNGTRKFYVDGILDPSVNLTGDFAPMMMAPNHHLILGARESSPVTSAPGIEGAFTGSLYDVRMYNYPLSQIEVSNLSFIASIKVAPSQRSLHAPQTMPVDIVLPVGANQSQQVLVTVSNDMPTVASLVGAVGNVVTLTYPIGGVLTQQVMVAGIADGKGRLTATGGGFAAGSGAFNVWAEPGSKLIGHWFSGAPNLAESSGFRPAGTHDGVAVGSVAFSGDVPAVAPSGAQSLDLSGGNMAVMVNNSSTAELGYAETFDAQIANKFSIAFWVKGTVPSGDWQPWVSKNGEANGYQVRRNGADDPIRPTFTLRGTPGDDDPYLGTTVDITSWHHYAATWDGTTGIRRLYLDGNVILNMLGDFGPMALPSTDHLTFGAIDTGGFWRFFPCQLFDVRVYSYALDSAEVGGLVTPPSAFSLTVARTNIAMGSTVQLVVTLPAGATATTPVTVYLTNNSPSVVSIMGPTAITFPVGTVVQVVNLKAIGLGQINITGGTAGLGTAALTTVNMVVEAKLIGHWLSGPANLVETSGYRPAGTHDGVAIGGSAGLLAFTNDVPAGFSGQSLDLSAGNVGVMITNSSDTDAGYLPTFDTEIAEDFTVAFWAKGFPGTWNPWVSKGGEGAGWQLRRLGSDPYSCFTVRGIDNPDGGGSGINVNNSNWHHYAGVWDQLTGTRALYVDGVLSHVVYNNPSQVVSLATSLNLALGARANGGTSYGAYFAGLMYDVRIYNYPLAAAEITSVITQPPAPPTLTIQRWTNNQVRISWPTSFTGYSLQQSLALTSGWRFSGLAVTVEGSENVAYAPASTGLQFFRLTLEAPSVQPVLTIKVWSGNQVRIAWPTSFTGFGIEQSSAVSGGWGPSGLSVTVEGSENAAYAPTTGIPQFFRLKK